MIIIIIRSLFIISNYFWQPKPLVVAKIYPALINGICWNRILNPTQSLANQVHFLVYTRFLFYHLDRYFEWRYVFSQQIRKYPSGRLLEFQPASQFCLVKMPQFHRWAAEELLARQIDGGIFAATRQMRGRARIDPESDIYHGSDPGQGCCLVSCLLSEPSSHAPQSDGWQKVAWSVPGGPVIRWE